MANVTLPYQLTDGTVADAAQVMSNFSAITNVVNGGIDNTNLSPTIAIADSKLNQITTAGKVSGTALTSLASIPSGAGVIPAANLIYSNISFPYVKCTYTVSSGTNGPAGSSSAWTTVALNTKDNDTASIATLTSNQITLPAGTFKVRSSVPMYTTNGDGSGFKTRLYNVTASTVLIEGQTNSAYNAGVSSGDGTTHGNNSLIDGLFTLGTSSAIALQYWGNNVSTLGSAVSTGDNEVYAMIVIEEIA